MHINRENCEAYFLDYHERHLSTDQVAELMVFLEMNPDLQEAFDAFEPVELDPVELPVLPGKGYLKRKAYLPVANINSLNYERWMIASMEDDLNANEKIIFNEFLEMNPDARLELSIFRSTRINPDLIAFPDKLELYKRGILLFLRKPVFAALAVAASLIIFFGLYQFINRPSTTYHHSMQVAEENFQLPAQGWGRQTEWASVAPNTVSENPTNAIIPSIRAKEDGSSTTGFTFINPLPLIHAEPAQLIQQENFYLISTAHVFASVSTLAPENKKKPVLGHSFVGRFIAGAVNRVFGPSPHLNKSILEYSLEGYNLMSDRDVELEKKYDPQGRVVAYMLDGEVVNIGRRNPVKTAQ